MITNDVELGQTMDQMERMYRAIAALRREVYPANPQQFALMAEGPLDELARLQELIDTYTGKAELIELISASDDR
jgi:hypothetical protein